VAELAMARARQHTGIVTEYRWSAFLGGPSAIPESVEQEVVSR
jgi:hypothetical protein